MAVPSSILRAVRGLNSTRRTYTLKPSEDLTVKLPVPSSFGTGNVDDAAVVRISQELGKVDTILSARGEVVSDDPLEKAKSETLKFKAGEFAQVYADFVGGKLADSADDSDSTSNGAPRGRRTRNTPAPNANGASS